jgi:hypothetical protein
MLPIAKCRTPRTSRLRIVSYGIFDLTTFPQSNYDLHGKKLTTHGGKWAEMNDVVAFLEMKKLSRRCH